MSNTTATEPHITQWRQPLLFALFGLAMGFIFEGLRHWLDDSPLTHFATPALIALCIFLPTALLLWHSQRRYFIPLYAVLMTGLAYWAGTNIIVLTSGSDVLRYRTINSDTVLFPYFFLLLALVLITVSFVQAWQKERPYFPYPRLFQYAWNNVHSVFLGTLFALLFYLVLVLGVMLFRQIGIRGLEEWLIEKPIVFMGAFGAGLAVVQQFDGLLLRMHNLAFALYQLIAYLVALIVLSFSLALLGFWPEFLHSGSAAITLLFLVAASILLLNTWVERGSSSLPRWANGLFMAQMAALPFLTALACYALWSRVTQYGLSPTRVLGLMLAGILLLYTSTYAIQTLRKRWAWTQGVQAVNPSLAMIAALLAFLTLTPVLDPLRLSVNNQLERLRSGQVSVEEFDFRALRRQFGQPGLAASEQLKTWTDHPEYAAMQTALQQAEEDPYGRDDYLEKYVTLIPADADIDLDKFVQDINRRANFYAHQCREIDNECLILLRDINGDQQLDAFTLRINKATADDGVVTYHVYTAAHLLDETNAPIISKSYEISQQASDSEQEILLRKLTAAEVERLKNALQNGELKPVMPALPDFAVDGLLLRDE